MGFVFGQLVPESHIHKLKPFRSQVGVPLVGDSVLVELLLVQARRIEELALSCYVTYSDRAIIDVLFRIKVGFTANSKMNNVSTAIV